MRINSVSKFLKLEEASSIVSGVTSKSKIEDFVLENDMVNISSIPNIASKIKKYSRQEIDSDSIYVTRKDLETLRSQVGSASSRSDNSEVIAISHILDPNNWSKDSISYSNNAMNLVDSVKASSAGSMFSPKAYLLLKELLSQLSDEYAEDNIRAYITLNHDQELYDNLCRLITRPSLSSYTESVGAKLIVEIQGKKSVIPLDTSIDKILNSISSLVHTVHNQGAPSDNDYILADIRNQSKTSDQKRSEAISEFVYEHAEVFSSLIEMYHNNEILSEKGFNKALASSGIDLSDPVMVAFNNCIDDNKYPSFRVSTPSGNITLPPLGLEGGSRLKVIKSIPVFCQKVLDKYSEVSDTFDIEKVSLKDNVNANKVRFLKGLKQIVKRVNSEVERNPISGVSSSYSGITRERNSGSVIAINLNSNRSDHIICSLAFESDRIILQSGGKGVKYGIVNGRLVQQ